MFPIKGVTFLAFPRNDFYEERHDALVRNFVSNVTNHVTTLFTWGGGGINGQFVYIRLKDVASYYSLQAEPSVPFSFKKTTKIIASSSRFSVPFSVIVACDSVILNAHQSSLRHNHNVKLSCYCSTTAMLVVKPFFTEMPQSQGALMKRSTRYGSPVTHCVLLGLY